MVEQLGIADALVIKQLGVHADRGKARNRIQLVENDLAAVVRYEKVHAGQAAAAECGINADSVLTDGRNLLLGDVSRNVQTRAFVLVLGVKGVELLCRCDLADRGGLRFEVAEHSALDLVTVNELLDEHLGIQLKCFGQALGQLEQIVRLGNAH